MLEKLADYDDELMEQLLGDIPPPRDKMFDDLAAGTAARPDLPGASSARPKRGTAYRAAAQGAASRDAACAAKPPKRLGVKGRPSCAQIIKTYHTSHGGKLSLARVLAGKFRRRRRRLRPGGRRADFGRVQRSIGRTSRSAAPPGRATPWRWAVWSASRPANTLSAEKNSTVTIRRCSAAQAGLRPRPRRRRAQGRDQAGLGALAKSSTKIRRYPWSTTGDLSQMVLWGQGEMHLRVALERLARRYRRRRPQTRKRQIPYKETIRKSVEIRGRHKKQSGGHGQFGDVVVEIKPQPRGEGFAFSEVDHGRRHPAQLYPRGRSRRARLPEFRAAGLPGGGCRGDA